MNIPRLLINIVGTVRVGPAGGGPAPAPAAVQTTLAPEAAFAESLNAGMTRLAVMAAVGCICLAFAYLCYRHYTEGSW